MVSSKFLPQSQRNDLRGQARESIFDEHFRMPPWFNIDIDRPGTFVTLANDGPTFPPSATRPLRILQCLRELVVKLEVNSWMVPRAIMEDL